MKRMFSHSSVYPIVFLLLAIGCKKTETSEPLPRADFTFVISQAGVLPVTVKFTSTSSNAETYQWFFDNGGNSNEQHPSATFSEAKIYQVKLVVTSHAGKDSITKPVAIILNKPSAAFAYTITNDGEMPAIVNFNNTSSGADTYTWDFDNNASDTVQNPVYTFNESRSYNVKLVASNAAGKDSMIQKISIKKINYSVRIFLITPTDRSFNQDYYDAIKMCALNLQGYYGEQMDGKTFILNNPMIDTLKGLHSYSWYNQYNGAFSGSDPRFYGYYNTFYELQQVIGSDLNISLYMNAVYVAAPGGGAGSPGLCALGDQDLDGLLGTNPTDGNINRWIGGSGHEWGHGFGLNHPADPNALPALMGPGLYNYPNCVLLLEDKNILNGSLFFK